MRQWEWTLWSSAHTGRLRPAVIWHRTGFSGAWVGVVDYCFQLPHGGLIAANRKHNQRNAQKQKLKPTESRVWRALRSSGSIVEGLKEAENGECEWVARETTQPHLCLLCHEKTHLCEFGCNYSSLQHLHEDNRPQLCDVQTPISPVPSTFCRKQLVIWISMAINFARQLSNRHRVFPNDTSQTVKAVSWTTWPNGMVLIRANSNLLPENTRMLTNTFLTQSSTCGKENKGLRWHWLGPWDQQVSVLK